MPISAHALRRFVASAGIVAAAVAALAGCTNEQQRRAEEDLAERPFNASFYDQPSTLPAAPAGTLIRARATLGAPAGALAWRIMFMSTDLNGHPVVNTGLLVTPDSAPPSGGRPIVSWGHPTTGSAEQCAPSRSVDPFILVEGLKDFLNRGYGVVYTDYTGMGTDGPNSYLVGQTEGRNVLDAARTARQLLGSKASNRVLLWGHSQGGQAVLFAAQLAPQYAPELDIPAAAVAAPATDLADLLRADIGDVSGVSISAYAFSAYSEVYGHPLDTILTPQAARRLPAMTKLCLLTENAALHAIAKPLVGRFLAADPATTQPWAGLLSQNSPGGTRLTMRVFVAQGLDDRLVRPESTDDFVTRLQTTGTDVTYLRIPGATHGTVALTALPALLRWLGP